MDPDSASLPDTDGDAITDAQEGRDEPGGMADADGDTITDAQESPADEDTDGDTVPDRHDLDSLVKPLPADGGRGIRPHRGKLDRSPQPKRGSRNPTGGRSRVTARCAR